MSLRNRLFVIISLIVLFILGVSLFLVWKSRQKPAPPTPVTAQTTPGAALPAGGGGAVNNTPPSPVVPVITTNPEDVQKNAAKQLARIFIERYNSYSTQNDYLNITEVKDLVTPTLWKKISSRLNKPATGPFVGVTTQVLSTAITSWSPERAEVELRAVKDQDQNGSVTRTQQSVKVIMIKSGKTWLADSFVWEK